MPMSATPRNLVIATFVALTVGFAAGYWIGSQSDTGGPETAGTDGAPHPVGTQEYLQLGMEALNAGNYPEAERHFRRATELSPEHAAPHADLAVSLMYQDRWDEAHAELERAKARDPEMPEVYFLEGIVHRDARGDTARARESWERFLSLVPADSPQAETVRGWLREMEEGVPAPGPTGEGSVDGGPPTTS